MTDIREKFLTHGIPYDDIDDQMIPLIDEINFNLGLVTKYCCYGHGNNEGISVMFNDDVEDSALLGYGNYLAVQLGYFVTFKKWYRSPGEGLRMKPNWVMESVSNWRHENCDNKKAFFEKLLVETIKFRKLGDKK
jgi:hypothetical protein